MSEHPPELENSNLPLFDEHPIRSMLDQLFQESLLYKSGRAYKDLLNFVARLRDFAPFNAMLLHVQRPGLTYAASLKDWRSRFGRELKEGARPLLILKPFGPVSLVYDVLDTEGHDLPVGVLNFPAHGQFDPSLIREFEKRLRKKRIELIWVDAGDNRAGLIRVVKHGDVDDERTHYRIHINQNHEPTTQFVTLAHELGHLFLGHLGADKYLQIKARRVPTHAERELEAESVAYVVCRRHGVEPQSCVYLSEFVDSTKARTDPCTFEIMCAIGSVEQVLKLDSTQSSFVKSQAN